MADAIRFELTDDDLPSGMFTVIVRDLPKNGYSIEISNTAHVERRIKNEDSQCGPEEKR